MTSFVPSRPRFSIAPQNWFVVLFNYNASTQLHEKVRRGIERLIADWAIQPGTWIPAERELARELYFRVTTIRTALQPLEQEGKIERAPGRWTLV